MGRPKLVTEVRPALSRACAAHPPKFRQITASKLHYVSRRITPRITREQKPQAFASRATDVSEVHALVSPHAPPLNSFEMSCVIAPGSRLTRPRRLSANLARRDSVIFDLAADSANSY